MDFQTVYLGDMHHFSQIRIFLVVAKAHSLMCPGSCDGIMHRKKNYVTNSTHPTWHLVTDR